MTTPTNKDIKRYADTEARRVLSLRRVNPELAARVAAEAAAECERMRAEQGRARDAALMARRAA